jgi:hypothetical protein
VVEREVVEIAASDFLREKAMRSLLEEAEGLGYMEFKFGGESRWKEDLPLGLDGRDLASVTYTVVGDSAFA